MTDVYRLLAEAFAESNGLGSDPEEIEAQWEVCKEEFREMRDEVLRYIESEGENMAVRNNLAEEMADMVFTVHLLSYMAGTDLQTHYRAKAMKNMQKSGKRDENGKIIDDTEEDQ